MKCPHCQKDFNAGKVMGEARTPKKTAAAKKRGEWMKKAFANQKKLEGVVSEVVDLSRGFPAKHGTWDKAFDSTARKAQNIPAL